MNFDINELEKLWFDKNFQTFVIKVREFYFSGNPLSWDEHTFVAEKLLTLPLELIDKKLIFKIAESNETEEFEKFVTTLFNKENDIDYLKIIIKLIYSNGHIKKYRRIVEAIETYSLVHKRFNLYEFVFNKPSSSINNTLGLTQGGVENETIILELFIRYYESVSTNNLSRGFLIHLYNEKFESMSFSLELKKSYLKLAMDLLLLERGLTEIEKNFISNILSDKKTKETNTRIFDDVSTIFHLKDNLTGLIQFK